MHFKAKIQEYYDFVLPLMKECGQAFLKARHENLEVRHKSTHELVTKYDKEIEDTLLEKIKIKYSDHKFIGEEGSDYKHSQPILTDDPTWIIDPIDGTTNFTRELPQCGISVGLTINKEQVLGLIYMPYLEEFYTAIKGQGAYLNGKKIRCSKVEETNESLFCYEISLAAKKSLHSLIMTRLSYLVKEVLAVRSYGGPVYSLCLVASGKLDAYQCDGLYPWDAAAGTLIVREAGGYVTESSGETFNLMNPNFLATCTESLAKKYLEIERKADKESKAMS